MKRIVFIVVALLLNLGTDAYAQDARNGASAAPQMLIPIDARTLGGGGAAALASGIEGILWNPAAVDRGAGRAQVMLAHRVYIGDIGVNYGAVGYGFGSLGTIAVSLRSFSLGEIEETDEFNMDGTGETFSPTFFTLGTTYSRRMTDRISIGATANLIYESFANVRASGVGIDAGVQYQQFLGVEGLRIGVAIRNIGRGMRYDGSPLLIEADAVDADRPPGTYRVTASDADMPTVLDLAVSYQVWQGLNLGVTYMENTYGPSEIRSLASYNFYGDLTIRGAYTLSVDDQGELDHIYANRPALGASLNLQRVLGVNLALDYGFMSVKYFDANHLFAIRGEF